MIISKMEVRTEKSYTFIIIFEENGDLRNEEKTDYSETQYIHI